MRARLLNYAERPAPTTRQEVAGARLYLALAAPSVMTRARPPTYDFLIDAITLGIRGQA